VGTAANGLELLSHPLLHTADILFIDCEMPIMNGIEAAIHINYKYPRMNMIAITMYEDSVYLDDITSVGFKGYVHKTEINTKLEAVMAQVLELDTEKKQ
jgi:DNA-binding NarL/FixJ family response regulator